VKQQYTGPYTFDLTARTITLAGIEIPQERLALVVNATVGFVYHNIEHEPTAQVTISGGSTVIVFPRYKDCETHRDSDALSVFYDDGVDLGQLIKDESDETQALLPAEFDETQTLVSAFKEEFKDEIDYTQSVLETRLEAIDITLSNFQAEALAESNATQTFLSDTLRPVLDDFKAEAKIESDATQSLLNLKLAGLINGFLGIEHLVKYSAENGVDIDFTPGGYGPSEVVFSQGGVPVKTIYLTYDDRGDLIYISPFRFDADALAYFNAVEAGDSRVLEDRLKVAINDFVVGCKEDNIWDSLRTCFLFRGPRTIPGLMVALRGSNGTNNFFALSDYSRKTGLKGDGLTKYVALNRNNNLESQNSKHIAFWVSEVGVWSPGVNRAYLGGTTNNGHTLMRQVSATQVQARLNSAGITPDAALGTNTPGFLGVSRIDAAQVILQYGPNSVVIPSASQPPANAAMHLFSLGDGSSFSNGRIGFFSMGDSIDLPKLQARVTTLVDSISSMPL
jgi:hypothetical protein